MLEDLRPMGGLSQTRAYVHRPRTALALRELLTSSSAGSARRFSIVGGRHSFGEHFLPPPGAEAIDTTMLGGPVVELETTADTKWVRVPGCTTFEALAAAVPGYLPRSPPTSDLITVAGALSACTHDSHGFFADHVRRFTLLTPDGTEHVCTPDAPGVAGELFRLVPGAFGAFGVILDVELGLIATPHHRGVEISILDRGTYADGRGLAELEARFARHDPHCGGLYIYGDRGATVLFGVREVDHHDMRRLPPLPLTDDAHTRNIVLQALANRFPPVAHGLAPYVLRGGRRFRSSTHGHTFFQRSYARSHRLLSSPRLLSRALRFVGVDPRLPVIHQTFVVPPERIREFLGLYFDILARSPRAVARLEQQDLIRLGKCQWRLHGSYGMPDGAFLYTSSLAIRRGTDLERETRALFEEMTERVYRAHGVKTLLLKQAHGDSALLAEMHRDALAAIARLKRVVDPRGVLMSRFLERLL